MGFGVAAALADEHLAEDARRIADLNQEMRCRLLSMPQVVINSPADALPAVLNISVPGYRSETMMHFLRNGAFPCPADRPVPKERKAMCCPPWGWTQRLLTARCE